MCALLINPWKGPFKQYPFLYIFALRTIKVFTTLFGCKVDRFIEHDMSIINALGSCWTIKTYIKPETEKQTFPIQHYSRIPFSLSSCIIFKISSHPIKNLRTRYILYCIICKWHWSIAMKNSKFSKYISSTFLQSIHHSLSMQYTSRFDVRYFQLDIK